MTPMELKGWELRVRMMHERARELRQEFVSGFDAQHPAAELAAELVCNTSDLARLLAQAQPALEGQR